MVLAEAMASGTPIVACSTGAIPEVLGGQGTLVPAGDWMGIARALAARAARGGARPRARATTPTRPRTTRRGGGGAAARGRTRGCSRA